MSDLQHVSGTPEPSGPLAYVLDDEPQVRAVVCRILASIGFVSRQFGNPVPFLAELRSIAPELIVLDLALGQSDAVEVIRYLESLQFKGKVLLISGYDERTLAEVRRIGESRGLVMLPPLSKPFRGSDLKSRLAAPAEAANKQAATGVSAADAADAAPIRLDPGEALRNRWLELWYQSKIDLKTMSVCGAEALLRARHPVHGIITPAAFLPVSAAPIYQPLTKFVIQQAMVDWEYFAGEGKPLKLAINVPLSVMVSPSFISLLRDSLPKHPQFPGLVVEVTEGDMFQDPDGMREVATQLKLYNIGISIDDFGAARSSLARLRDLPCMELKLDRSFVSGCAVDGAKQSICSAVIDLAHGFGVSVCAEGVEKIEDLRTLMELGCPTAQGYLFGKPTDSVSFLQMLLGQPGKAKSESPPGGLKRSA